MRANSAWKGVATAAVLLAVAPLDSRAALDQNCVVNVLNRTVQVSPAGGWSMPNVPSNLGRVRARATCIQNNQTVSGESDYFTVVTNGITTVGDIEFDGLDAVPVALDFSQQGTLTFNTVNATAQLVLRALYADGSLKDVTAAVNGSNYSSTNPQIASVSPGGLIIAHSSGTVLITARKDEVVVIKQVVVNVAGDIDGDGLPDDFEIANGLNPSDPIDAQEDQDADNLTALREFQLGTDPRKSDTDGDGLSDGAELAGSNGFITDPLKADTDGDGLSDRIELLAGSSPLNPNDRNFAAALDRLSVSPGSIVLTFNTINNEVSTQLTVTGILIDGSTVDLTRKSSGTTYGSGNLTIASFGSQDGEVFAGQAGTTTITVANSGKQFVVPVKVESFQPTALSAINIPGYANNVDVAGDYAFVAAGSAGLQVVNVSNRNNPTLAASLDTDGTAIDIRVFGNYAYLADGEAGLKIIDISNPNSPRLVAAIDTAGIAQDIKVDKQFAYVADGNNGLVIFDVKDPAQPVVKSQLGGMGEAKGVDAEGTRAVVAAGSSVFVVDVTNAASPNIIGSLGVGSVKDVVMQDDYAYLAAYSTGYRVISIADPAAMSIVGGDAQFVPRDVELTDGFAFFAEQLFPNVIAYANIQNPAAPVFQGVINLSGLGDYAGTGIAVDGSYVYVTEESFVVSSDYQATGSTKLFIAQYRLINDNGGVAPTVAFTRPALNASVVEGTTITAEATAQDDVGVRSVAFSVDGQPALIDTTQPYQIPVVIPLGKTAIKITATATDFGGNANTVEVTLHVLADADRDGLGDEQETGLYGTNPNNPDTDGDGLKDGEEVALGTNALVQDSDGDGRNDKLEIDQGTDPLNPDVTPPTVVATTPAAGATGIPENQPVMFSFSERLRANSVKATSIQMTKSGAPVAGSVQLLMNGTDLVFTPTGLLDDFTEYVATVSGVRDLAGNPLAAPVALTYTTGNVVDTTPPSVVNTNPANGATNVAVNVPVTVLLSEPINPLTVTAATFHVNDSQGVVPGTGTVGVDGRTLTFVPNAALSVGRSHTVYLTTIRDLFGNAMNTSFSFTTGYTADAVAPKIVNTTVQAGQTDVPTNASLGVSFDEPVSTLSLGNVQLLLGGNLVALTRDFNSDHRIVFLETAVPLQASTSYTLIVNSVEDLSGNVLATGRTITFTTGAGADLTAPGQVSRTPVNGATGVPLNAIIEATFNERINPLTVIDTSVKLYDGTTGQFPAGVPSLSADGRTVRFTPSGALTANHLYYFYTTYNTYVEDLAGNRYSQSTTFTTGTASHTGAPQIQLSSVVDGATGVPVNGRLVFQFDTPLADRCVNSQTVQVTAGATAANGTLVLSTDRRQLTFTPQGLLSASTVYTVSFNGVCDLAGNTLSGVSSSFTTSAVATADTTAPTVTIAPANGASNVAANTPVTFTFNEPIDVTTLAAGTQVTVSGLSGEVAGQLAVNGNVVSFTPAAPLPGSKQIFVSVSSVRDLAGNAVSRSSSFTTGVGTDVTAPQLLSITPQDHAVDIGVGTPIVLTFSESLSSNTVNNSTFALFVNGAIVQPSVSRSQDNRTVSLSANLPASSVVSVIVTNDVQDLSGNSLSDFVSVFTTAPGTDSGRPSVVSQFPGSGASGVLSDASIVLYTNEPMNESTLGGALHIAQNGQLVGGTISSSANGRAIVFRPLQPWASNALIEVFVDNSAQDVSGNALNNFQGSFRTVADARAKAAVVVSASPNYGSNVAPVNTKIDLLYNEALSAATVNSTTVLFRDYNSGQVLAATVSLIKGGQVIRVVPQAQLAANHAYYVQTGSGASSVVDLDGQAAQSYFLYFTTGAAATADTQAPQVLTMSPPNGSTNVGINGHVHVLFDEPVNTISLLPDQSQTTTYGSLFWSDDNRNVELVRHQPYALNTAVTESVATIEDYAGNHVGTPNSVTFTTGNGPDFTAPQDIYRAPFQSATNVPVNTVIKIGFNEPIDPVSVNASTVYLYDTQTGEHLAGNMALDADGRTIVYVPSAALAVNRQFYAYAYGVKDLSGNIQYAYLPFTTSFVADSQAPVVLITSVADGLTNVPTNADLSVLFDEPMADLSFGGITLSSNGTAIPATRVPSADRRTVSLQLNQPLQASTSYTLIVNSVEDLSGNVLAAPRTITFTTGSGADLTAPVQVSRTPVNGASGVPLNAIIEATFNERINPLTVIGTSVKLYDGTTGQFPAGVPSLSADGRTVRFTPSGALTANHLYYFYTTYNTYVEDLAGNRYSQSTTFTTGAQ